MASKSKSKSKSHLDLDPESWTEPKCTSRTPLLPHSAQIRCRQQTGRRARLWVSIMLLILLISLATLPTGLNGLLAPSWMAPEGGRLGSGLDPEGPSSFPSSSTLVPAPASQTDLEIPTRLPNPSIPSFSPNSQPVSQAGSAIPSVFSQKEGKAKDASRNGKSVSPALLSKLTREAKFSDVAYCVSPPGPGLSEPFNCIGRCKALGDVQLIKSWAGLGIDGEGRGATGGYVALDLTPPEDRPSSPSGADLNPPSRNSSQASDDDSIEATIKVVFRGTYSLIDALSDLALQPQPYKPYNGSLPDMPDPDKGGKKDNNEKVDCVDPTSNCSVHAGFYASWAAARPVVLDAISSVLDGPESSVTERGVRVQFTGRGGPRKWIVVTRIEVVGHSLGAAVACLAGLDMVRGRDYPDQNEMFHPQLPVTVTTFGEPRVGNLPFAKYVDTIFVSADEQPGSVGAQLPPQSRPRPRPWADEYYRVTHQGDPVPLLPPRLGTGPSSPRVGEDGENEEDGTALYSPHSHEIFIVPDDGVDVKPEDVLVCRGRADEDCSIGKGGKNEAFWGAEGWIWKWIGRMLAGKGFGGGGVEKAVNGTRTAEANPEAEAEMSALAAGDETGPPAPETSSDSLLKALLPTLPAPIWKQIKSHRQYFVLIGLCVPEGWGW